MGQSRGRVHISIYYTSIYVRVDGLQLASFGAGVSWPVARGWAVPGVVPPPLGDWCQGSGAGLQLASFGA